MRTPTLVASVIMLGALGACSGSDDSADTVAPVVATDATGGTSTDTDPPVDTTPQSSAPDVTLPGGSTDTSTTSTPDESGTAVPGGPLAPGDREFPGGTDGVEVLTQANLLSRDGRLVFTETAPAPEAQAAICDYLFGAPDEVAEVAGLSGTITLEEEAGYLDLGVDDILIQCGYEVDGEFSFGMAIWFEDLRGGVADQPNTVTVALPSGRFGGTAYETGWAGPMIDADTSERWLTEADSRLRRA